MQRKGTDTTGGANVRTALLAIVLLSAGLAGCVGSDDPVEPAGNATKTDVLACEHPWPCADGSEWPVNLTGPFEVEDPQPLRIPGHEGVELEAYVWQPDVPEGVEVPTVLHAQPYAGQCYAGYDCDPAGDDPFWLEAYKLRSLVEAGYAVVNVNVRGTGTSGGCFEMTGPNEGKDLAQAVEWLADKPWSNGRVAMTGLSYMGTTPWIAANENPPSLKTIVPGGIITNEYTFSYTPQGAGWASFPTFSVAYTAGLGVYPPVGATENAVAWSQVASDRVCQELATMFAAYGGDHVRNARHETYFEDRRHVRDFSNLSAAVFVYHGLQDNGGHGYQEDAIWSTLDQAPKRMMLGDWGHTIPDADLLEAYPGGDEWSDVIVPWLDFWLKGLGDEPPRLGTVDYQTRQGEWLQAEAWPLDEGRQEALYLADGKLPGTPVDASSTFQATTDPLGASPPTPIEPPSQDPPDRTPFCERAPTTATFTTEPVEAPVTLAGNPLAYLQVESDQPGGIVALDLYDLGPDAACEEGELVGGNWLVGGAADLRFHQGNYEAEKFPTGEPTPVRVDLLNLAHTVEEGHQLAIVASGHGHQEKLSQPYAPTITLHGDGSADDSHVVLPTVDGTLGGTAAGVDYPPRPFVPGGSDG